MAVQYEEVMKGIYRIPVPLTGNPLKELNSYVIRGKGTKNLLIDTGFHTEECRRAIEDSFAELGLFLEETDILLTHFHTDHSGNVAELIREGNRVMISEIDRTHMPREAGEDKVARFYESRSERLRKNGIREELIREMVRYTPSRTMAPPNTFTDYHSLKEGDRLQVGDYVLQAIYVPGHTPGQMCFLIEDTGAMILGDHVLFDITPNITDWPDMEDALGAYLDSLDKVDRYEVTLPLPGHRHRGDFHGRIAALKEHHRRRLAECREAVRRLGHARLYDISGSMTWKIRAAGWDDFPPAQRWFALGETFSHLDHLKKLGQIQVHEDESGVWYEA